MTDPLAVYCLDVGQGDCTFILGPGTSPAVVVLDCADAFVASRFLDDHQIRRIDAVVISHQDLDHIKGIAPLIRGFLEGGGRIDAVWVDDDRMQLTQRGSELFAYLLQLDEAEQLSLRVCSVDTGPKVVAQGKDWTVDLVLPLHADRLRARRKKDPNLASAAIRVHRAGRSVLLGGDVELGAWEKLNEHLLPADVFRVPHHGGHCDKGRRKWSGYDDLYTRVNAEVAVISVGTAQPGYGHPQPVHVQSIVSCGSCSVMCTQLTTRCHPSPADVRDAAISHAGAVVYPWRHHHKKNETPCAGSTMVLLHGDGTMEVEPTSNTTGWHQAWVQALPTPICAGHAQSRSDGET